VDGHRLIDGNDVRKSLGTSPYKSLNYLFPKRLPSISPANEKFSLCISQDSLMEAQAD